LTWEGNLLHKLFGTDGVRGVANVDLTPELSFQLGRISAYLLSQGQSFPFFLIGKDTRRHGDMLEGALAAGISSSGVDIHSLGIISTPGLAYLTRQLNATAGIIISASHNPIEDNGLKIFGPTGIKISDQQEEQIEKIFFEQGKNGDGLPRPRGGDIGRVVGREEAVQIYLEYLRRLSPDLSGISLALDCGHGAVYRIAPELFRSLGAHVEVLHHAPDGTNINVDCGSTNPSRLQQVVVEKKARLGLAFDGDADRLIAVDEKGQVADGDLLMYIFTQYLQKNRQLKGSTLVSTVMSNAGLEVAAQKEGIKLLRTKVGDRFVLEKMMEGDYNLGGEQSGHIIFSDHGTTGDGLLTSLQLLRVLTEENCPLSYYREKMPRFPQVTINCRVARKDGWEDLPRYQEALNEVKERIGEFGRVLVRPSGTEPLMRVMVEGDLVQEELEQLARYLCDILARELNH